MKLTKYQLLTAGLLGLTICSGTILASTITYADNDTALDQVEITVPTACTMSGSVVTGQEHSAELTPGTYSGATGSTYENGIGKTTLTTYCNDNNGFSIYAIGFTSNTEGDNTLVGTSASGNATISTKVYESTDTTSNWSMKVTKVTDTTQSYNPNNMTVTNSFNTWHTVPDDYTKVAEYKSTTEPATTDTTLGAKLETTYATYISTTQPADTYTGQVKYVMVHPYDHAAPEIPITSLCQPGQLEMQNVAQWKSTVTSGTEVTACDNRDGKTYTIAKLADNNLWMTQNLDHDISTSFAYTNENTDIGWNTYTESYDVASWTPIASTHATGDDEWDEYDENTNPDGGDVFHAESSDPGDYYWDGTAGAWDLEESDCIAAGGTWNDMSSSCDFSSTTGDPHYHLGNYYNWTAAVAMNDSSSYTGYETLIEQSICPAGWTLPRVGTGEDTFAVLWNNHGFSNDTSFIDTNNNSVWDSNESALWTSPLYLTPSGTLLGEFQYVGYAGYLWSPVTEGGYNAYEAHFTMEYGYATYVMGRYIGSPVRCIARPVSSTVSGL